jgi:hypothetical protein
MSFNSKYPWSFPWKRLRGLKHQAIDYLCKKGTPTTAPTKMQQSKVYTVNNPHPDYGCCIYADSLEIKGLQFIFAHLSALAWARVGKIVQRGEVFAWTGGHPGDPGAGISNGDHEHFECRLNGVKVDPALYF